MRLLLCADSSDDPLLSNDYRVGDLSSLQREGRYEHAKSAVASGDHDVYLIDALFSGGRGVNLAQAAARRGSRPVIVLARRSDPGFESKMLARGIADVLVRAEITPALLERSVRHAAARSARERRTERSDPAAPTVGLPAFEFRLQNAVARARRGLGGAALLAVRVRPDAAPEAAPDPGMRAVLQGDALERVRSSLRDLDTICRVEGILLALLEDPDPRFIAAHAADHILQEMSMPFGVRGRPLNVVSSIGVSVFPDDGGDAQALLESAKQALDDASESGQNVFRFATSPMTGLATRRIALERTLERAVEREEFTIQYQPQIDLATGRLVGVEALLRWKDPELGSVDPGEFVPLLESADLIEEVGEWVLRTACRTASGWASSGDAIKVSVNVSAKQFALGDVVGVVQGALAESRLPPELLTLELTEGVMLDSTPEVRGALGTLRERGVQIAVDDFGTGYASLRYIKHFPMDIIKIDKEFVRGLPLNTENAAITNAIAALAHSLGLMVVAEGVENEAEAEFLRDLRCHLGQGYLHARPMEADEFDAWRRSAHSKAG